MNKTLSKQNKNIILAKTFIKNKWVARSPKSPDFGANK